MNGNVGKNKEGSNKDETAGGKFVAHLPYKEGLHESCSTSVALTHIKVTRASQKLV